MRKGFLTLTNIFGGAADIAKRYVHQTKPHPNSALGNFCVTPEIYIFFAIF